MKVAAAKAIERIEREFHQRAFGDERARVNALPAAGRRAYLARLRRRAVAGTGGISTRFLTGRLPAVSERFVSGYHPEAEVDPLEFGFRPAADRTLISPHARACSPQKSSRTSLLYEVLARLC
jgi:hypothetical protein